MLSLLVAAALASLAPDEPALDLIGPLTVDGRPVTFERPVAEETAPSHWEWEGWRYQVGEQGRPVRRFRETGGWREVATLYDEFGDKVATAPVWRVKVFVLTRLHLLGEDTRGVRLVRRGFLGTNELDDLRRALAQTKWILEGALLGGLRVEFVLDTDTETFVDWNPNGTTVARAAEGLFDRVSTGEFEAEDRIDRGPFADVWVVTPDMLVPQEETGFSHVPLAEGRYPDGSFRATGPLLDAFLRGVQRAAEARRWPFPRPSGTEGPAHRAHRDVLSDLAALASRADWDEMIADSSGTSPALLRRETPPTLWADVERPWATLPRIANLPTAIRAQVADFVAAATEQPVVGLAEAGVVFADLPSLTHPPDALWRTGEPDQQELASFLVRGGVRLTERESGFELVRFGPEPVDVRSPVPPAGARAVRLAIRVTGPEPLVIQSGGAFYHLNGTERWPAEVGEPPAVTYLVPESDRITVPVDGPFVMRSAPYARYLEAPAVSTRIEINEIEWIFETNDTVRVAEPPSPQADVNSQSPYERALAAVQLPDEASVEAREAVAALLSDRSTLVQLSAALALSRTPHPPAESALTALVGSSDIGVAEAALRALNRLDTPSARLAVRQTLESATQDRTRQVAAELLGATKNPVYAGPITLLASRGWRSRLAIVEALGSLDGDFAPVIHAAFSQDSDPAVRRRVMQTGRLENATVRQRIQFYAVNDPADSVRAAAFIRLIFSGEPRLREEGYRGVRDNSWRVRLAVLEAMRAAPMPDHRGFLLIGTRDADARVRAAAVRALGPLPEAFELLDTPIVDELDFRVHVAYADMIEERGMVRIPRALLARLLASDDPELRARAERLAGG